MRVPDFSSFKQDARFAARLIRRNAMVAGLAVVTLAVGIGANTAVFSLVDAAVLHPLAYPRPDRLVVVWTVEGKSQRPHKSSYPDFSDWQQLARSFDRMAAFRGASFIVTGPPQAEALFGIACTPGLFDTLGIAPAIGRTFQDADGDRVALISHGLWVRRFAARATVVGGTVRLEDGEFTVLGVMPADFHFQPRYDTEPDVFVPVARDSYRTRYDLTVVARLKSGTRRQAQAEMNAIAARIAHAHPELDPRQGIGLYPLHDYVVRDASATSTILLGTAAFVLLIACVNVANLLLARSVARGQEFAVRVALGAGRARLVRQTLTESLLLAVAGGMLGVVLAFCSLPLLAALAPVETSFFTRVRDNGIGINGSVLAFTVAASIAATLLVGALPAFAVTRPIRSSTSHDHRRRASSILVALEVALSFVLVAGAGLMLNSLWRLMTVDLGFRPDNLIAIGVSLPGKYGTDAQRAGYYAETLGRLSALPGVRSAAAVSSPPITRDPGATNSFVIEASRRTAQARFNEVSAGYFRTMGIPVVQGREFGDTDGAASPGVAIVNRSMARRFWAGGPVVGETLVVDRVHFESAGGEQTIRNVPQRVRIVGVVADSQQLGLDDDRQPMLFLAHAQRPPGASAFMVEAAERPSATFVKRVSDEIRLVDPDVPSLGGKTMEQLIASDAAPRRFVLVLLALFACVALGLAAVGIYGVTSHAVARRSLEIAVRTALGARPGAVVALIARQHLAWTTAGVAIGIPAAVALTRMLEDQLFGVEPGDPLTYAAASVTLLLVAAFATLLPALRAARVAPAEVLRGE